MLDHLAGPLIMNSKMEYTRCGIPSIEMKVGNKEKEENPDIIKEKATRELIKMKYKKEEKRTKIDENDDQNEDKISKKKEENWMKMETKIEK